MLMTQETPLVSTVENTFKRLISYHIAVWFMVFVALVLQLIANWRLLFLGFGQIALAVAFAASGVAAVRIIKRRPYDAYKYYMEAITKALLAALLLPVQAPFYVIVFTIIFIHTIEWVFKKLFRKNIMHPVLLSLLIVHLIFRDELQVSQTMINIFSEASLEVGRIRLLIGVYEGLTLGTTAFLILGLLWIYLSVTKIIQFKMSVSYLAHMLFGVIVITLLTDYTLWQLFTMLILGYTLFVLVFFIAEPTSTPETDEMMVVFPFISVLFTLWFRLQFDIIEAALYAVIFAQFFTWVSEQLLNRTSPKGVNIIYGLTAFSWIVLITILIFT